MKTKKTKNNEYMLKSGIWVRNFTDGCKAPLAASHMYDNKDYGIIIQNEQMNRSRSKISEESIKFKKIVIVSNGYNFHQRHLILEKFPKDVCVLAINGALKDWKLKGKRAINAYVVNNPYNECINFMPRSNGYYPICVSSVRTNYKFLQEYKNNVYAYCPTPEEIFGLEYPEKYFIDDYRSPVCAAIGLAYQFGVEKLMLMCCDESFIKQRDFTVQLPNGLWTYPHHIKAREIIDANLHWLTHQKDKEVVAVDYSDGGDYFNAPYINSEKDALNFFNDGEDSNGKTE